MFEKITPEAAGISSALVEKLLRKLDQRALPMHSLLMMKGDKLFAEYYWSPFHKDRTHRAYSQTKSYTSVAIGLLEEDGKLSLDDPISKYFPEKIHTGELEPHLAKQTIRQMLTMTTVGECAKWFDTDYPDRTELYFNYNRNKLLRPAGTIWDYDSAGSQVLANLCEKLSGMNLFDFLNERIFKHLGTFKTAFMLKTRNGDAWGDSAMICTPRDTVSFARFVMNLGKWNGKRLLNEKYLRLATSAAVDNTEYGFPVFMNGYGYQIWHTEMDGFAFYGMGSQYAICIPSLDLIIACNADTQGYDQANDVILGYFFDLIAENIKDTALPADPAAYKSLCEYGKSLKLYAISGKEDSPMRPHLSGKVYECYENPMGWKHFSLDFSEDGSRGTLRYENAQGKKELPFRINENDFGYFPELGYSDMQGGLRTANGHLYRSATSAAWKEDGKLIIKVQIIDKYFGNAIIVLAFRDGEATVFMKKTAEDFLQSYAGVAVARLKE